MSKTNIYVLRLEGGNFYVGKSNNVMLRYQEHLSGGGSDWTRKHKPVALDKTFDNVSPFEEDKITKEYMAKYGIDKVRGGAYVTAVLSDFQRDALNMEIWAAQDCCTNCGRKGHFIADCNAKTDASGNKIVYEQPFVKPIKVIHKKSSGGNSCYRCGRSGHYSNNCYAGSYVGGADYDSDTDDSYYSDDSDD
jgi:predicted GIY-YIG superfamily endonuclease